MLITDEIMKKLPFQTFRKTSFIRARPLTEQDYQQRNGTIQTREGRVTFEVGDYLARGISDEEWPIAKHLMIKDYTRISEPDSEGFCSYRALDTRQALQMHTKFTIHYNRDTLLSGKAGDYLVAQEIRSGLPNAISLNSHINAFKQVG